MSDREAFYPPTEVRKSMRRAILNHLESRPGELTASELVKAVCETNGRDYGERDLILELSGMIGSTIRMHPNNTLAIGEDVWSFF